MSLRTLSKRLATVEDTTGKEVVNHLVDVLIDELGNDEARRFWDLWHTGLNQRTPEEHAFVKQVLANPAVISPARRFISVSFAEIIRQPIGAK